MDLFNGSDSSIILLTSLVSYGKMIEGVINGTPKTPDPTTAAGGITLTSLTHDLAGAFFGCAIATVWPLAVTYAFVLDSGYNCGSARYSVP
jgi:hypothetical protein